MKPQKLTMCAFGSYGGEEVVDFGRVGQGIFLITGDTGAGKTTIFDGVAYALFGEMSGGARDGSMMRSQYAPEERETCVELIFTQRGEQYTIRRSPAYDRISKRKNKDGVYKKVNIGAKASLILPDGKEFAGNIRDINLKVQDLIGLDREQFSQIAMIAQGEYLKLLHASSKERKLIFSKIFQTGIYGRIQMRLREEFNRLYGKLEDNRLLAEHERGQLQTVPASALFQEWEELKNYRETRSREIFSLIEKVIRETGEQQQEKKVLREKIQKEQINAEKLLDQAKDTNRLFEQKEKCGKTLQELSARQEEIKEWQNFLKKGRKAERVMSLEDQYLEAKEREESGGLKIQSLKSKIQRENESLRDTRGQLLYLLEAQWQKAKSVYEKSRESLVSLQEEFARADKEYNRRYELFLEAQAGIMAARLKNGKPCPVCGSAVHPKKASLPETEISQSLVEKAKKQRENLEKKRSLAADECIRLREVCQSREADFLQQKKKCPRVDPVMPSGGTFVELSPEACESAMERIQKDVRTLKGILQAEQENEKKNAVDRAKKQKTYSQARKEQGFHSVADYTEAKNYTASMGAWERQIQEYEMALLETRTSQKHYEDVTRGKEPTDVSFRQQEVKDLSRKRKEVQDEEVALGALLRGNQQVQRNLKSLLGEREKLEQEYAVIRTLYQTANGKLAGTAGVDFQTFIQRRYFNQMIQAANRRLKFMTDGQFILQCRDMADLGRQGEVGLDLDVYSVATGKVRDVKTLSGGESFMAALSMALGMADIIQNTAGNVRVDTMFIDEGFGSLDEDSRLRAIRILQELAGDKRNIGIISHVTELKEQIEHKITVKKDEKGSRIL